MRHLILTVYILGSFLPLFAQNFDVITYDTSLKRFDKELIFDKPFTMLIPYDGKVTTIRYVRHLKGRNLYSSLKKLVNRGNSDPIREIVQTNVSTSYKDNKKYLNIFFGFDQSKAHPYRSKNDILQANRDYTILLPELSKESFEIFNFIHQRKDSAADKIITRIRNDQISKQQVVLSAPELVKAKAFFTDSLQTHFQEIDNLNLKLNDVSRYTYSFTAGLDTLFSQVATLNDATHLFDHTIKSTISLISRFNNINSTNFTNVTMGKIACDNVQPIKLPSALKNVTSLEILVVQLIDTISLLKDRFPLAIINSGHLSELYNYLKLVRENIELYKAIDEEKQKIINLSYSHKYYIDYTSLAGESTVLNFDTRNKFQLTPEFGLVYYGFQENFKGLMPYVGFHINFSFIHKDYPYWKVPNKTFFKRSSIMVAWGLISVSSEGKRTDFFKNAPLLLGWGIRLTNAVRVVAGPMLFYRYETKPFATEKKLTTTLFGGVSIDLNVRQYINTITDVIIPK